MQIKLMEQRKKEQLRCKRKQKNVFESTDHKTFNCFPMLTILAVQTFRICVLAAVTESEFVSSRKPRNQKTLRKPLHTRSCNSLPHLLRWENQLSAHSGVASNRFWLTWNFRLGLVGKSGSCSGHEHVWITERAISC